MKNPTIWAVVFLVAIVSGAGAYFYFHNQEVKASTLSGTVTYRERIALPAGSVLSVTLTDTEGTVLSALSYETQGENVPLPFSLTYEPTELIAGEAYFVSAEILSSEHVWKTEESTQVFGGEATLELLVVQEREGTPPAHAAPAPSILNTSWEWDRTEFLSEEPTVAPAGRFVLSFDTAGRMHSTTDCNAVSGTYVVNGEVLSIGQLASTLMGCTGETFEQEYTQQLSRVVSYSINGNELRLNLIKDSGTMVFEKR